MVNDQCCQGDFVGIKTIPTRSAFQLTVEFPIEEADAVLKTLGGIPQPGSNRPVVVTLLRE